MNTFETQKNIKTHVEEYCQTQSKLNSLSLSGYLEIFKTQKL